MSLQAAFRFREKSEGGLFVARTRAETGNISLPAEGILAERSPAGNRGTDMRIHRKNGPAEPALEGAVRVGTSTKRLLSGIGPRQIILIRHRDLDDVAAEGIIRARVRAVINAEPTISGRYPVEGGRMLLEAGIPVYEIAGEHFGWFADGMRIRLLGDRIELLNDGIGSESGEGGLSSAVPAVRLTPARWRELHEQAHGRLPEVLDDFIANTLRYAGMEKEFFTRPFSCPHLATRIAGRHAVVVARGGGCHNDLRAIREYIADYRPVLIGVDGGADVLLECGFKPDLIVGDMDSVTDGALKCGAELVVHAYPDGRAPGLERVRNLGLEAKTVPAPGTSEDVALLIAYESGAELLVTLGTRTHMIDFLQKGRKGMGSTLLVRMKIGSRVVDAKGVSRLYNRPFSWRRLWLIPATALFPVVMLGFIHPGFRRAAGIVLYYLRLAMT